MMPALKAVGRFWWLAVIGLAVGLVAAAGLVSRQPPAIYTASDTVLVSSPNAPYLRTAQMQITQTAGKGKTVKGKKPAPSSSTTIVPPDTQVLVERGEPLPPVHPVGRDPQAAREALRRDTREGDRDRARLVDEHLRRLSPVAAAVDHGEDDVEAARGGREARDEHRARVRDLAPSPAAGVRHSEVTAHHDRAAARARPRAPATRRSGSRSSPPCSCCSDSVGSPCSSIACGRDARARWTAQRR